ncbi:Uncharacterised protein [uncultured archaeon]|nr:Uncharacterised protein [uncultured archaeon]
MKMMYLLALLAFFPVITLAGITGTAPIPPAPNFYVNSSMVGLCRGQVTYVPITVGNRGATGNPAMQNIVLSWANARGLSPISNYTATISNVSAKSSKTVYLPVLVSPSAASFISTAVNINYNFYTMYSDSEVRNISFSTYACPSPLSVAIDPEIITEAGQQNLTFNLTNTGNSTLSMLSVSLSSSGHRGVVLVGNQPEPVVSLLPNMSAYVNQGIYVTTDNISQLIPINVSVNFYNGSNLNQLFYNHYLLFGGIIDLNTSSLTVSPSVVTKGSTFSISFVLTNMGTSPASSVTAKTLSPAGFTPYGTNPTFVGSIAADSQSSVTLSLTAKTNLTSGTYTVPIKINYLNELRQNLTKWVNVSVKISGTSAANYSRTPPVRTTAQNGGDNTVAIALVAAAVLCASAFFVWKKKGKAILAVRTQKK